MFESRVKIREMSMEAFIEQKASGTLRKNQSIGMNVFSHALAERVAYEFGYGFETCPARFVTYGEARSEGDCKALTEVGWFVERYKSVCLYPDDEVEVKYIIVEINGIRREGVGMILKTSCSWLPNSFIVFAIIAEYNTISHDYNPAVNPC